MIVYGTMCCWWDEKENASILPSGLPCCPHCKSVLFEAEESKWEENMERYIKRTGDVDYREFIEWLKGKCYRYFDAAREAFDESRS